MHHISTMMKGEWPKYNKSAKTSKRPHGFHYNSSITTLKFIIPILPTLTLKHANV